MPYASQSTNPALRASGSRARKEITHENQTGQRIRGRPEKALRFYTEALGFTKKSDFSNGPYRWLTVVSRDDLDGTELQLALNDNPAARAYQQAIFGQGQPAVMFFTDDIKGDYERISARGAEFTMPPTEVTGSTIAQLDDTCGNLIQIAQLARWRASTQPTEGDRP